MSDHSHTHAQDHGWTIYAKILAILLVLTGVTVYVAGFDFGAANLIVAILIATVKAALVALFFMHLRHDKPFNAVVFLSSLLFLSIFLLSCLLDVQSRFNIRPTNWEGPEPGLISPRLLTTPPGTAVPAGATATSGAPAQPATQPAAQPAPVKH